MHHHITIKSFPISLSASLVATEIPSTTMQLHEKQVHMTQNDKPTSEQSYSLTSEPQVNTSSKIFEPRTMIELTSETTSEPSMDTPFSTLSPVLQHSVPEYISNHYGNRTPEMLPTLGSKSAPSKFTGIRQ